MHLETDELFILIGPRHLNDLVDAGVRYVAMDSTGDLFGYKDMPTWIDYENGHGEWMMGDVVCRISTIDLNLYPLYPEICCWRID